MYHAICDTCLYKHQELDFKFGHSGFVGKKDRV